ncbi:MAG: trimeric intracellular cation channel family protein [Clostridium sp.]|nr:trimeric intracellular cation channel family protein [Clostridium sp.]
MIIDEIINILELMGSTFRIPISFVIIEFIATFASAISGIRLASAKHFDWFGAYIVGTATAIGGGTLRDVMLGIPPFWMTNPIYIVCCAMALFFVIWFGKYLIRQNNTLFIFDAIALALFNIIGIEKTLNMGYPYWTAIIMGTVTGAAGGVIRDVFINVEPLVFRKDIYAMACVFGGIVYMICDRIGLSDEVNAILSFFAVIAIRVIAVKYHWGLPVLKGDPEENASSTEEGRRRE